MSLGRLIRQNKTIRGGYILMKKSLSLILAAVLAFGGAVSAFAASGLAPDAGDPNLNIPALSATNPRFTSDAAGNVYVYSISDGIVTTASASNPNKNSKSMYLEIDTVAGMKESDMKKFKVKGEWTVGKDLIEKTSIVYKKNAHGAYSYYAEIKPKESITVSKSDLVGTITLYKSSVKNFCDQIQFTSSGVINAIGEPNVKFTGSGSGRGADHTVYEIGTTDPKETVFSFGSDLNDMTILFNGVGEFEIDVEAQDKLFLGFDRKVNKEIVDMYPTANMEFVNFLGQPAFFRTGVMNLYADVIGDVEAADTFVYAVDADGVITAVKSTYNEDLEAHKFAVRKFARTYIISDRELELDEAVTETPVAPDKTNPNTGR